MTFQLNRQQLKTVFVSLMAMSFLGCAGLIPVEAKVPSFHLVNLRMLDSTVFEQRMEVSLRIENPNPFPLAMTGLRFDLEVNDQHFARATRRDAFKVPRLGEETVDIIISTNVFDLARQVANWGQRDELTYRIDGEAFLDRWFGGTLPFEKSGSVPLVMSGPRR